MDNLLTRFSHHLLIVTGDFNRYDQSFLTSHFPLRNIVSGPTRLNATLDFIFIEDSIRDAYDEHTVEIGPPIGKSDHNTIFAPSCDYSKDTDQKKHVLFDLRESNLIEFEKKFLAHDFERFYAEEDIDAKVSVFYEFLRDALTSIPQREVKSLPLTPLG